MMNLITGATGHLGNVLVRSLLARGQKVRALVRPGKFPISLASLPVEIISGDVLDPDSLIRAMDAVEIVYHLAARVTVAAGPDPETERVNLEGTRNVIAAARRKSIRRLVYASSIYALHTPDDGVVDESCPFDAESPRGAYDRSKAAASLEVQKAAAAGLDAVIVCPTAVAGPFDFQMSEAGRGILYNMRPGPKFFLDGAYDFVDVRDAAAGHILAAEHGRSGETYILGGERLTVREVSQTIWEATGFWCWPVKVPLWLAYWAAEILPYWSELTGRKPLFTTYALDALQSNSCISHAKAARELGYKPRPVRQALGDAVRWWQEQHGELQPVPETIANAPA